jgi:hypothetical protein
MNTRITVRQYVFAASLFVLTPLVCFAQKDPGVRHGPAGGGAPLPGLTSIELDLFNEGVQRAIQLEAACDEAKDQSIPQSEVVGLRPRPKHVPTAGG